MADQSLKGLRVAILATDGFEQSELLEPRKALSAASAESDVVSLKAGGKLRGWNHKEWGQEVAVDEGLDQVDPEDYGLQSGNAQAVRHRGGTRLSELTVCSSRHPAL